MTLKRSFISTLSQCRGNLGLAVSGGPDSMALAWLTSQWLAQCNCRPLVHAFTVDHRARSGSRQEAQSVGQWLGGMFSSYGRFKHTVVDIEWDGKSMAYSTRFELEARNARRRLLLDACSKAGISYLLTGHTLDDQLETFIMRLLSGSSQFGLAGMDSLCPADMYVAPGEHATFLVKPLLDYSKKELVSICNSNDICWVHDPTNFDPSFTMRNSIRTILQDETQLPAVLRPSSIQDLMQLLRAKKHSIYARAFKVIAELESEDLLNVNTQLGTAQLCYSPGFEKLDLAIRALVFGHILQRIAPINNIYYRNSSLQKLASRVKLFDPRLNPQPILTFDYLQTRIDIFQSTSSGSPYAKCQFYRQRPVRNNEVIAKFRCCSTGRWSSWKLFDNRFWIRVRLNSNEASFSSAMIICKLLFKPKLGKDLMSSLVKTKLKWPSAKILYGQPFVYIEDEASPESQTVIGFPTLGIINPNSPIDLEYKLKEAVTTAY